MTAKRIEDQVTDLEIQLAYVQRMYDHLNEVVTREAMRADRLEQKVSVLQQQLKTLKEKSAEPASDPLDERPPHY